MQAASPTPKTPRELRSFGLIVGSAFLVLGGISWWRGHLLPPRVFWGLGGLLALLALFAPRALGPVERGWLKLGAALGYVNTRILLLLIFFLVLTPIAVVMRLFRDPMDRRLDDGRASQWKLRPPEAAGLERYRMPF